MGWVEGVKMSLRAHGVTEEHKYRVLQEASRILRVWLTKVRKIKAVYHTLNFFNLDITQNCFIADGWVPLDDLYQVQYALKKGAVSISTKLQT